MVFHERSLTIASMKYGFNLGLPTFLGGYAAIIARDLREGCYIYESGCRHLFELFPPVTKHPAFDSVVALGAFAVVGGVTAYLMNLGYDALEKAHVRRLRREAERRDE